MWIILLPPLLHTHAKSWVKNKPCSSALHWAASHHPRVDNFPLNTTPSRVLFLIHPSNLDMRVERVLLFPTHLLSVFEKVCQEIQAHPSKKTAKSGQGIWSHLLHITDIERWNATVVLLYKLQGLWSSFDKQDLKISISAWAHLWLLPHIPHTLQPKYTTHLLGKKISIFQTFIKTVNSNTPVAHVTMAVQTYKLTTTTAFNHIFEYVLLFLLERYTDVTSLLHVIIIKQNLSWIFEK